jgi:hypothetical protein
MTDTPEVFWPIDAVTLDDLPDGLTLDWEAKSVEVGPVGEFTDAVKSVTYYVTAHYKGMSALRVGKVTLSPPQDGATFIPFNKITNSKVGEWITSEFPELAAAHGKNMVAEINGKLASPDRTVSNPFAA